MTIKLYDKNAYTKKFNAVVITCEKSDDKGYKVVLDKTAFFPEGGGQSSDTGKINNSDVFDVREENGEIVHYVDGWFETGSEVSGEIDWDKRFRKMQNHSGEHIISGIIFKKYGFNNVGFHLGKDGVTVDIDNVLSSEQLLEIEYMANSAVYDNVEIVAEYPDEKELKTLQYRSKIDISENVRIVTIGDYDRCACCALHVSRTGEIGVIKILDTEKYKGGIRIHMLCGYDAIDDYNIRYKNTAEISSDLSAKQSETSIAVKRLLQEISEEKRLRSDIQRELTELKVSLIEPDGKNICIFEKNCDMNNLRNIVNGAINKCSGICAGFCGSDKTGYKYIIASNSIDLKLRSKEINKALNGKGGGNAMLQGNVACSRSEIEKYIKEFE